MKRLHDVGEPAHENRSTPDDGDPIPELLQALPGDKSNISRSLRTLEAREWIVIERTAGGKAQALYLTPEGLKKASEICMKLLLRDKKFINNGL